MSDDLTPAARVLLDRFFSGEATAQECEEVAELFVRYPAERARVEAWRAGVRRVSAVSREMPAPNVMYAILRRRLDAQDARAATRRRMLRPGQAVGEPVAPSGRWVGWSPTAMRRSATYLVAVIAGVFVTLVGGRLLGWSRDVGPAASTHYATGNGQRATITLSDGTTVVLNVASQLDVPADYARGNHTVRLRGAALFTTAHHVGTPLSVVAGGATARVLGTSFVVRHYAADATTTVAVREGKVVVQSVVLRAAQQVAIRAHEAPRVSAADPAQFTFSMGVLTLDGVPLSQAILELNRWYDADVRLGDARLASRHVTGECAAGSLADLAKILELTFDVRVVRDGRVLTLFPK